MLKSLIFSILTGMTFSAYAQNSQMEVCLQKMKSEFLASNSEAQVVCSQDSSPQFVSCMVQRANNSNIHVLDAAPICSRRKVKVPVNTADETYNNFKSCPSKLAIGARMRTDRAREICDWDSSSLMQSCLIDLVEKAGFHSEHAIQYCGFANSEYRSKIPQFVSCVISNARRGFFTYENVLDCDDKIVRGITIRSQPQPEVRPTPEVKPAPTAPANQTSSVPGRRVPTPVEIKIEGTNPEVQDQPVNTGSTSNSEALPLD